jgi:hypothetical protein
MPPQSPPQSTVHCYHCPRLWGKIRVDTSTLVPDFFQRHERQSGNMAKRVVEKLVYCIMQLVAPPGHNTSRVTYHRMIGIRYLKIVDCSLK